MGSKVKVKQKHLVSICIPVLNEEASIPHLMKRIKAVETTLDESYDFEYIFTDNASTDGTWSVLQILKENYTNLRAYRFSKNIGFQKSILFNYGKSKGKVVIQLDADLQDPPELIPEFLKYWEQGHLIVSGVRTRRQEAKALEIFRRLGYWLIDFLSDYPIKRNTGDFRLLDRKIVDALIEIRSPKPYLRGTISRMGVLEKDVLYSRDSRNYGRSKFTLRELIKLGMNGIANNSNFPMRVASFLGGMALLLSVIGSIYVLYLRILQPDLPRGFASLYILGLFGLGVNAALLGIAISFIKKVYEMLNHEDVTIVEAKIS